MFSKYGNRRIIVNKFDFEKWYGVIDEDNRADEYYGRDDCYVYCDECDNLMVPNGKSYKCPVCGCIDGSRL